MTSVTLIDRRAQSFTLNACSARACDLNTAADLLRRSLMLFQGFASIEDIKETFGKQVDMLGDQAGQIATDLDDEHLAIDLVSFEGVRELEQAYQRAIASSNSQP